MATKIQPDKRATGKPLISADELRRLVEYDPETGVMVSRVMRYRVHPGDAIGAVNSHGHLIARINYTIYYVHRLAWLYMTGQWPGKFLDHVNGDRADNRWVNLREATAAENVRNRKPDVRNRTGIKNVYWLPRYQCWRVIINADGRDHFLGHFHDIDLARRAAEEAQVRFHGAFAPGHR